MKRYIVIGISDFLSDIFDLIHCNDGRVYKLYKNVKDIQHDRVLPFEKRVEQLGYACQVYDSMDNFEHEPDCEYVLGTTSVQKHVLIRMLKEHYPIKVATLIHPSVILGSHVHIGEGVLVNGLVVIAPNVVLDDFCVVNRAVSIGHDVTIGKYTRVGPSVSIGGSTKIGDKCSIGIGACILEHLHVGDRCVVGASSVVTKDLPEGAVAIGMPAKIMEIKQERDISG